LAALASGVGASALLTNVVPALLVGATGSVLMLFSAFCFGAAIWREFKPRAWPPKPDTRRLPLRLLASANGFLALTSLAALICVWIVPR